MTRVAVVVAATAALSWGCTAGCNVRNSDRQTDEAALDHQLTPSTNTTPREGLAAAIVIDVSGSMSDDVWNENGRRELKIDIARRAAHGLVAQFADYASEHRDEPVQLGLYVFSRIDGQADLRTLMPMGPPDVVVAAAALQKVSADGGTPIGTAMIAAKRVLDGTGLTRRHLLVVTDGANTDGVSPVAVATAIGRRPEHERPSMYFVAFDVDKRYFDSVRDQGALVLAAANATELNDTLNGLLRGKILVEQ